MGSTFPQIRTAGAIAGVRSLLVALLALAASTAAAIAGIVGLCLGLGITAVVLRELLQPSQDVAGLVAAAVVYLIPIPTGVYLGVKAGHFLWSRLDRRVPDA